MTEWQVSTDGGGLKKTTDDYTGKVGIEELSMAIQTWSKLGRDHDGSPFRGIGVDSLTRDGIRVAGASIFAQLVASLPMRQAMRVKDPQGTLFNGLTMGFEIGVVYGAMCAAKLEAIEAPALDEKAHAFLLEGIANFRSWQQEGDDDDE